MVFGIVLFVSETLNNNLLFVCLEIYWGSLILTLIHYLTLHDTICILRQKKKKKSSPCLLSRSVSHFICIIR